jgi:hypothetical protein
VDFLDAAGHVQELHYQDGKVVDEDVTTAVHGAPATVGALAGYWGSDSSQQVVFLDGNDDVHELYWTSSTSWVDSDLTAAASNAAPASASAGLTAYTAPDGSRHVGYVANSSGEVRDLAVP